MPSCRFQRWQIAFAAIVILSVPAFAGTSVEPCPRPQPGILLLDAADLRSQNGVLKVDLTVHNSKQADGSIRYCYLDGQGNESPTPPGTSR